MARETYPKGRCYKLIGEWDGNQPCKCWGNGDYIDHPTSQLQTKYPASSVAGKMIWTKWALGKQKKEDVGKKRTMEVTEVVTVIFLPFMPKGAVLEGKHQTPWQGFNLSCTSKTEKISIHICCLWCLWGLWASFCTPGTWKPFTFLWIFSKTLLELLLCPTVASSLFFWCQLVHSSPGNNFWAGNITNASSLAACIFLESFIC